MAVYSSDLSKIQTDALDTQVHDLVLKGNVVTHLMLTNNPKQFPGKNVVKAVSTTNYSTASGTVGYGSGLVEFNYSIPQTKIQLTFNPEFHFQEVAVDYREIDVNNIDPKAAVKMKLAAMEEAGNTFANRMGTYLYGTDAAVTTNRTQSIRAIADDGTEASTYGGQTRSAMPDNNLDGYFYDANGTLSTSNDEYIMTAISGARVGGETPNLILTTDALYNIYEGLLTKTYNVDAFRVSRGQMTRLGFQDESRMGSNGIDVAFSSIYVHGAAMVADQLCPAAYMFFLNLGAINWYSVPVSEPNSRKIGVGGGSQIKSVYSDASNAGNINMFFRNWMTSEATYGQTGVLILHGNLISFDPRKHAKLLFS